ncbi:dUTP diphosphatase [Bacillus paranthracis]
MNLTNLFEVQEVLKQHIGYKGEDKFPKMMLAMLVEFMECANDWRGFKYWSKDQNKKPSLLEETVDGLHFVLETGLDLLEQGKIKNLPVYVILTLHTTRRQEQDIVRQYKQLTYTVLYLDGEVGRGAKYLDIEYYELLKQYMHFMFLTWIH